MIPTKTVQNVIDRVTRQFGDESGVQINTTDIIGWVNTAQLDIAKANNVLKGKATSVSVAGTYIIDLTTVSANILSIVSIRYDGLPLQHISFNDAETFISKNDPTIEASGEPLYFYEFGTDIYLYPKPQSSGKSIDIFYNASPVAVTSSSDVLSVPDSYFDLVCQVALKLAYEQDDDWIGASAKSGEVASALTSMAQDREGLNQGFYPAITVLDEFEDGWSYL